ncbi:hypothetical protein [Thermoflexus sp.]|uniref:hypothetical protein n=1 Tax=Thermoflexus sp. TaxID=1969742 RepID=UPI0025F5CEDC|nr:hypothetical protein [Thermoflexus sp.]MCS7350266.1 hypothetical protein [Thermoflexus sp.]MCX7689593.1 hypothetical protein [Thermoflexus sp.]MDW8179717.1 hypothetical protein [Anaerolineae bacterium]MDW8184193.1 hypothetical protein [Anaerolineae bacterium]
MDKEAKELREMLMRMTIQEILDQDPEAAAIFEEYGIYEIEVTCTKEMEELLEDAAAICGFDLEETLDRLATRWAERIVPNST